jgi:hypothetical protein
MALEEREAIDVGDSGSSEIERANSAGTRDVRIRSAAEQELDDVGVPVAGGHHQWCEAVAGDLVGIGAAIEKRIDRLDLRFVDGMEKRSPIVAAGRLIGICTVADEVADGGNVSGPSGVGKRSEFRVRASDEKSGAKGESHFASLLSSTLRRKV